MGYNKLLKSSAILLLLFISSYCGWGTPPAKWDDYCFGLVSNGTALLWEDQLKAAIDKGIRIDRRYVYINNPDEISTMLFTPWTNYAKKGYKGLKPAFTAYMLQNGGDGLAAVLQNASDQTYMKKLFTALKFAVDSSKGTSPIYVLEPDVWGYLLQNDQANLGKTNLNQTCYLNNLGCSWLTEFDNKLQNYPAALIKTIKTFDPDAYVGILMAFWAYQPAGATNVILFKNSSDKVLAAADKTAEYINLLLGTKYRGDFVGFEKYGADAGYAKVNMSTDNYYWTDSDMANYVAWCKRVSQTVDLPAFGWQICLGHTGLPNTDNRYEDTFYPYFFTHVNDFIQAGFIGMLASCANQGKGTLYTLNSGTGDDGWFLQHLQDFNKLRSYNLNITTGNLQNGSLKFVQKNIAIEIKKESQSISIQVRVPQQIGTVDVDLYDVGGAKISTLYKGNNSGILPVVNIKKNNFSMGVYYIRIQAGSLIKMQQIIFSE